MRIIKVILGVVALLIVVGFGFVYAGLFNVAADDPHWGLTQRLLEVARDRSIVARAKDVPAPPALDDPKLVALGAQEYSEMCTGCHLAPGMEDTEMRTGLYPKPPNLANPAARRTPAETFWVIKHGLKMTGMPAWGLTHDDQRIWSMVAFLQKLPQLSPDAYRELTEESGGHSHGSGETPEGHHSHNEMRGDSDAEDADHQHHESSEADESKPHEHHEHADHAHKSTP